MRLLKLLTLLLFSVSVLAQKPFEGKITYKIKYDDLPQEMAGLEKMLPSDLMMVVKGTTSRAEQNSVFGGKQVMINHADHDSTTVLVDILGQKLKYTIPVDKRKVEKYRITEMDETKVIKGYTCKKAVLQTSTGIVIEVWYLEEFMNPAGSDFPKLKGLPLEYELSQKGMTLKFKASSVKEEPIDETYFVVPEEYEETSFDQFNALMRQ